MPGTYTNLLYHIVFSTKGRLPLISPTLETELYAYIGGIARKCSSTLLEIGGVQDHVHLLVKLTPTTMVAEFLKQIKASSSKWMNDEKLKPRAFAWQDGYSAFSVSESQVAAVRRYIQDQKNHHAKSTFQDELRALLDKHRIKYEEDHLWG